MKKTKGILNVVLVLILVSCSVKKISNEELILRYAPESNSTYDLLSNVNIALNTAQPVNINMDLFSTVIFGDVEQDGSFSSISKITRVKSIASSSIFHRSYDSDNPLLQNDVEKQMHEQFSHILNLDFASQQNDLGEKLKEYNYDSIFGNMDKIKSQFKEMEQSISNTSLIYPSEKVKVGSSWLTEVKSLTSMYPVIQNITYTVTKITQTEVFLSQKGNIVFETDIVEGGGTIEGNSVIDRKTGIIKTSKTTQVMKMKIEEYRASSVNTIEVSNVKRID